MSQSRQPYVRPADANERCLEKFGFEPTEEQMRIVDHIGQGQDCILIAGCGWGKSLVYFLPLVLWEGHTMVIISPLTAVLEEQQRKLEKIYGISSIALNSDQETFASDLMDVARGKYRAVFMTPGIILDNERVRGLWSMTRWRQSLQTVVIDEIHCMSSWGKDFTKAYDQLKLLRSKVPPTVAFIVMSATLPPATLDEVKTSTGFEPNVPVYNFGNNRDNIMLEVRVLPRKNTLLALDFLIQEDDIPKTIVYFDSIKTLMLACRRLRSLAPDNKEHQIVPYHSLFTREHNARTVEAFRLGTIRILLATEEAGVGCDLSDVVRVVQYRNPTTLSCLVQRLGRAVRDRDAKMQGFGILLANPSSGTEPTNDAFLDMFIRTKECRRHILDQAFGNNPPESESGTRTTFICCDNCSPSQATQNPALNSRSATSANAVPRKRNPQTSAELQQQAFDSLTRWRTHHYQTFTKLISDILPESAFLPDETLLKLSQNCARICEPEMIRDILPECSFRVDVVRAVEAILFELNENYKESQQVKLGEKKRKREE